MELMCPCCRATNATISCRRCKADLSLMMSGESYRDSLVIAAKQSLVKHQCDEAFITIAQAEAIRPGDDLDRLKACGQLLSGDYRGALHSYNRIT